MKFLFNGKDTYINVAEDDVKILAVAVQYKIESSIGFSEMEEEQMIDKTAVENLMQSTERIV